MKKRLISLIMICISLAVFCLSGCFYFKYDGFNIEGNGQMSIKEVSLESELKGVRNTGSFEVVIDPSLEGKAIMEGESNLLDLMQLEQDSFGVLNVAFKPNTAVLLHKTITVRIPVFNGGMAETDGSGNIMMQGRDAMQGDLFELRINGSGDISLNLETKEIRVNINGSGDIALKGSTETETVEINGSGDLNAFDCTAKKVKINVNGSGNSKVNASEEISGTINGSGDIIYDGNPGRLSVEGHGSGDVGKR